MAKLPYIAYTELMVGSGHPTAPDTLSRGLRAAVSQSGYNPDADPFPGLFGPVINVKAYGAVGDDATDDTAAIQTALNAVPISTAGGTTVFFPIGSYKITAPLLVHSGTHSVGAGDMGSRLRPTFGSATGPLLKLDGN